MSAVDCRRRPTSFPDSLLIGAALRLHARRDISPSGRELPAYRPFLGRVIFPSRTRCRLPLCAGTPHRIPLTSSFLNTICKTGNNSFRVGHHAHRPSLPWPVRSWGDLLPSSPCVSAIVTDALHSFFPLPRSRCGLLPSNSIEPIPASASFFFAYQLVPFFRAPRVRVCVCVCVCVSV